MPGTYELPASHNFHAMRDLTDSDYRLNKPEIFVAELQRFTFLTICECFSALQILVGHQRSA